MCNNNFIRIIPPICKGGGLCYILMLIFNQLLEAIYNDLIPIIDLTHFDNFYLHTTETIDKINSWEYYFRQPTDIIPLGNIADISIFDSNSYLHNDYSVNDRQKLFKKYIRFNDDIIKSVNSFFNKYINQRILGVRIRGTDYVNTMAAHHCIQPSIDQVIADISIYLKKYRIDKIYVSTDESKYFKTLKDKFGSLIISQQTIFVDNPSNTEWNGEYLNKLHSMDFIVQSQKEYLANIIILSKCQYLISGSTSATPIIELLRDTDPISEKVYNFGTYDNPMFALLPSGFVDINRPINNNKPYLILHPDCKFSQC